MQKTFISAQDLLDASFRLAAQVYESGYRPSHILGVWRGGAPIAIAVHEALCVLGWPAAHYAVQAASYGGDMDNQGGVSLFGIESVGPLIGEGAKVLIVDDIFDTGLSMKAILGSLDAHCKSASREIKIATAYYKPARNQTMLTPDYFVHSVENWVVFPHELIGCTAAELRAQKNLPSSFLRLIEHKVKRGET